MPQIILSPRVTEDRKRLADEAMQQGWSVCQLDGWRISPDLCIEDEVAIYGEPLFCRIVAAQIGRVLLEPPLDWLVGLPDEVTSRKIQFIPLSELSQVALPAFIKPPDDKIFTAGVYQDLDAILTREDLEPTQQVLVSEVIDFEKEFRIHLLDGEPVSGSRYSVYGDLDIDGEDSDIARALVFATEVYQASNGNTPPAVVIDVGLTRSGAWAVVEANPCFGAGIYAGNETEILRVLLRACSSAEDVVNSKFYFPLELE
ncbi:ATP-grasp domain-containing protein [Cerasicoccus frondis]|uniref:ATP-grasp domain-containing protein n=1 Tax=Cerasicoccus frondis TaxID=490090 RepID=UPI0028528BE1|nr:ATP-grasp domain-containing protein [Cerasicoccus frondis]